MSRFDPYQTILSRDGVYRYRLHRSCAPFFVANVGRTAVFVMLNPSTADAEDDDPTIRRCVGFARSWNCAELLVVNLFAVRGSDPTVIPQSSDPVGPGNRWHVVNAAKLAVTTGGPVVCAWGTLGCYQKQDRAVLGWLRAAAVKPACLKVTKDGYPAHPLYLPKHLTPLPYTTGRAA